MAIAVGREENVRILRPIRVLVVSRDRPFVAMAKFLLARDGLETKSSTRPGDLFELVQQGVDVVVIDATASLANAASAAAELEALYPGIGVIVVCDERGPQAGALPVLPKWAALEGLGEAARRAYLRLSPA
jgi:DNA-binding NtrC family response regulator